MESRTLTVLGLRTRILEERGLGERDPIILVHGVGGWAENWREVMAPLAATGRRAIALDLPGFGESERPGRVSYFDPDDAFYPRFVIATMDALGIERAHVVGNSMGGSIALLTAVNAPARTRSLVLVAPGGFGASVARSLRLCAIPGVSLLARLPLPRSLAYSALRSVFYDPRQIPRTMYDEVLRFGLASFPEFVRAMSQALDRDGVRRSLREAWLPRADRYAGPLLAVWGREDAVIPATQVAGLRAAFPRAQVRIVERCGHVPMIERTHEFLDAVVPFLERAERAVAA